LDSLWIVSPHFLGSITLVSLSLFVYPHLFVGMHRLATD
jgi:hypothetical protein